MALLGGCEQVSRPGLVSDALQRPAPNAPGIEVLAQLINLAPCDVPAGENIVGSEFDRANVRLVGNLDFENQRRGIIKLISSIDGVQRVDDQMMVKTVKRK